MAATTNPPCSGGCTATTGGGLASEGAAGGLAVGVPTEATAQGALDASTPEINAWVVIQPDDTVIIRVARAEMGQGTHTGLALLVAEELDCDWKGIHTEIPEPGPEFGPVMGVYGSLSVRTQWMPLRRAGAARSNAWVRSWLRCALISADMKEERGGKKEADGRGGSITADRGSSRKGRTL